MTAPFTDMIKTDSNPGKNDPQLALPALGHADQIPEVREENSFYSLLRSNIYLFLRDEMSLFVGYEFVFHLVKQGCHEYVMSIE